MGLSDDDELIRAYARGRDGMLKTALPNPELVIAALARKVLDLESRLEAEADARWDEKLGGEES